MVTSPSPTHKLIGELLIDAGIIREDHLPAALAEAHNRSLRLGEVLIMLQYLSAADLESALQAQSLLNEGGLDIHLATAALKIASEACITFNEALKRLTQQQTEIQESDLALLNKTSQQLARAEADLGPSHNTVATLCLELGDLQAKLKQFQSAEESYKKSLAICERAFGLKSLKIIPSLEKLADLCISQKRFGEAETLGWRILEITQQALGPDSTKLGQKLHKMASILELTGKYQEAEQFYVSVLRIKEKNLGPTHPEVIASLRHLAQFWKKQGPKAEHKRLGDLLLEAGFLQAEHLPKALQQAQNSAIPLGQVLIKQSLIHEHDLRNALQAQLLIGDGVLPAQLGAKALKFASQQQFTLKEALKELGWEEDLLYTNELKSLFFTTDELMVAEKALGADHCGVAALSMKLGDIYFQQKRYLDAEQQYRRSLAILEKTFGSDDLELGMCLFKLAQVCFLNNKYTESEPLHWRALQIRQHALGTNHLDVATSLEHLAEIQARLNNYEQSEHLFKSALAVREKALGSHHLDLSTSIQGMADSYFAEGQYNEAEPLYLRLLKLKEKSFGLMHLNIAPILNKLAELYCARGEYSKAETQYEISLEIYKTNYGKDVAHPDIANTLEQYAKLMRQVGKNTEGEEMELEAKTIRASFSSKEAEDNK